jgi:biotin transport system permease protein
VILSLYIPGESVVHRTGAGAKLGILFLSGIGLFLAQGVVPLALAFAFVVGLVVIAGLPWRLIVRQLRTVLILLAPIFLFHALLTDWMNGTETVLRIVVLVLLAVLVTLTTPSSRMIEVVARTLRPLAPLGVNAEKIGMMLSMVIRFVPMLMREAELVREAQRARGLERSLKATVIPLTVRTLRMADNLAEAIDARGYDPTPAVPFWRHRERDGSTD